MEFRRLWLGIACVVAMSSAAAQEADRIRISGSATLGVRLVPALASAWLRDIGYTRVATRSAGPGVVEVHGVRDGQKVVVEVASTSSAQGVGELIGGEAQLAMMSRRPSAAELEAGWQLGNLSSHDQEFVLALDGVAVIVNTRSPLRRLRTAQLRELFAGNDAALDGHGVSGAMRLHLPAAGTASREMFDSRVMQSRRLAPVSVHASASSAFAAVKADPMAIAVVSLRAALPAGVRALAISEGGQFIAPTRLDVLSEDYPLARRLYLYGGQMMGALGRSFALHTMTLHGQRAVDRAGHLAVTLRAGAAPGHVDGPEEYRTLVRGATRLPLTLRFNFENGDNLVNASLHDSRSVRDVERLVAFMRAPAYRNRQLLLVGFAAPGARTGFESMLISNDRVDFVARELLDAGLDVRRTRGFGASRPLLAGLAQATRARNERVEVWLL